MGAGKIPTVRLSDGGSVPQVGLGLWKVTDADDFSRSFEAAVSAGYSHFDTAQAYGNEQLLGQAWKNAGVKRDDIFLTTKIRVENIATGRTAKSFEESLSNLHSDYVDLLLLHFPVPLARRNAWKVLERLRDEGRARHIGVSNFTNQTLRRNEKVCPAIAFGESG